MAYQQPQPQRTSFMTAPGDAFQQYLNYGLAITESVKNNSAQLAALGRQKWADETTELRQLWNDKWQRENAQKSLDSILDALEEQKKKSDEDLLTNDANADNMKFKEDILKAVGEIVDKGKTGDTNTKLGAGIFAANDPFPEIKDDQRLILKSGQEVSGKDFKKMYYTYDKLMKGFNYADEKIREAMPDITIPQTLIEFGKLFKAPDRWAPGGIRPMDVDFGKFIPDDWRERLDYALKAQKG